MEESIINISTTNNIWIVGILLFYLLVFFIALAINRSFNTILVGVIYLIPLIPYSLSTDNNIQFLISSFQNTIFGIIELTIVVITTQKIDFILNRKFIKQLFGHTLPIAAALIGLSLIGRFSTVLATKESIIITLVLFLIGATLRILSVYQIGALAFKFEITFRKKQLLKSNQIYKYVRHPSYLAMMIVIISYAINGNNWIIGVLGVFLAWGGFQYRIHHEEKALFKQFGKEYLTYQAKTPMWIPFSKF